MVLINPFSGTKIAPKIFNEFVLPLLTIAGVEKHLEYVETQYKDHCTNIAKDLDLNKYKALVTVSGDGLFHELINGLLTRSDWREACKIPIGFIPGGTSNALGKNLDIPNAILATLSILKCKTRPMDVMSVIQGQKITFTHLSVSWGLIADIDIESEKFRRLGELRMTIMALIRLIRLRSYRGTLYLLPTDKSNEFQVPLHSKHEDTGPTCIYTAPNGTYYKNWPIKINTDFQYFLASNLPWIAKDFMASSSVSLDDGEIDLVYADKLSRIAGLGSLLGSESGKHLLQPAMMHYHVKAFVLEPHGYKENQSKEKLESLILNVSGERVPYEPIMVEIHRGAATLIAPTWFKPES
jgi:diacylglycerol kinase family enzyme